MAKTAQAVHRFRVPLYVAFVALVTGLAAVVPAFH